MHKNKILMLGANSDLAKQLLLKFSKENSEFILLTRNTRELDMFINNNNLNRKFIEIHQIDLFNMEALLKILNNIKNFPNIIICAIGELINSNHEINHEKSIIKKMIESNYIYPAKNLELISQYLIKHNTQNSSIVGISSVAGIRGKQSNYEYGAAKSAFSTYLSGLRNKLYKNNIHVCTVEPGFIKSKMTKNLRINKFLSNAPEEIAQGIFLAIKNKKEKYIPLKWKIIIMIISFIPESVFKKLSL